MGRPRALLVTLLVALATLLAPGDAQAEEPSVPIGVEAQLLAKVAGYDRHLSDRAGDRVNIVVLTMPGSADAARAAAQMVAALAGVGPIGGLPHDDAIISFTNPKALADLCKQRRVSILFLTPGFGDQIEAIRAALDGVDVLSASAVAGYVPRGIVLGFDLVSGKPKLLVNLTQAKKQKVQLSAEVLKLMKVYE